MLDHCFKITVIYVTLLHYRVTPCDSIDSIFTRQRDNDERSLVNTSTSTKNIRDLKQTKMKMTKIFSIAAMLLVVVWSGCTRDDEQKVRPRVVSTSPVNAALGVATNNDVTATFSVEMNPETITNSRFTL